MNIAMESKTTRWHDKQQSYNKSLPLFTDTRSWD